MNSFPIHKMLAFQSYGKFIRDKVDKLSIKGSWLKCTLHRCLALGTRTKTDISLLKRPIFYPTMKEIKTGQKYLLYQAIIYLQLKNLFINSTNIYRVPTIYKASWSVFFWSLHLEKDVVVLEMFKAEQLKWSKKRGWRGS